MAPFLVDPVSTFMLSERAELLKVQKPQKSKNSNTNPKMVTIIFIAVVAVLAIAAIVVFIIKYKRRKPKAVLDDSSEEVYQYDNNGYLGRPEQDMQQPGGYYYPGASGYPGHIVGRMGSNRVLGGLAGSYYDHHPMGNGAHQYPATVYSKRTFWR